MMRLMKAKVATIVLAWAVAAAAGTPAAKLAATHKATELATAGDWISRNLIPGDPSFETGRGVWRSGSLDESMAFDGKHSLKVKRGVRSWKIFFLKPNVPYVFSCYLKSERPGGVSLSLPKTNWRGEAGGRWVEMDKEWKRYELKIPARDKRQSVWLAVEGASGTFWLDACQLEEGEEMTPYRAAEPVSVADRVESPVAGNVFYPDEPVNITFNLFNHRDDKVAVTLPYKVKDYYDAVAGAGTLTAELGPKESLSRTIVLENLAKKGFYAIQYGVAGAGGLIAEHTASFCIVAPPLPYSSEEGSLFGLSSIASGRIPAAARIGVKWTEARFYWPWIEKEKGRLDEKALARAESRVEKLLDHGINVMGRISRTPKWAGEYDDPGERALIKEEAFPFYEAFVRRVVSRNKDKIHFWLNWGGEDDLSVKRYAEKMGKPREWVMERFAQIMRAGYRGAKRADDGCEFGAAGQPSGVDCSQGYPFTRRILTLAGEWNDMLGIDCYTWPRAFKEGAKVQSPEELGLTRILEQAVRLAEKRRCFIAEYGFALGMREPIDGRGGRMLADYMARSFLLAAGVPRIEHLLWFACWPSVEGDASYDMWRWPNPLPVVPTYSALAQVLTGARNPRELALGGVVKGYCFEKKEGTLAALWTPSNREVGIKLGQTAKIRVLDIMGNSVQIDDGKLKLSGSPLYLLSEMPAPALARAITETVIDLKPVLVTLQIADLNTVRVRLINQLNKTFDGKVVLTVPLQERGEQEVEAEFRHLRPQLGETLNLRLPAPIDIVALGRKPLTGAVLTGEGQVRLSQRLSLLPCRYVNEKIAVDGNLSEWKNREFLELRDASFLAPPDALSHRLWTGEEDLSVRAWVGWDRKRFYFAARVRDDVWKNESDTASTIWRGDSIQIAFDPRNDAVKTGAGYDADDSEFSLGRSDKLKKTVIFRHWPLPPQEPTAELAVRRKGDYVFYELALPFEELRSFRPQTGKVFGFNFVVNDSDRGSRVDYWMGLTPGICGGKDPSAFKKFVFLGE